MPGCAPTGRCWPPPQVARFNHSHTLTDVRRFIRASRRDMTVRQPARAASWGPVVLHASACCLAPLMLYTASRQPTAHGRHRAAAHLTAPPSPPPHPSPVQASYRLAEGIPPKVVEDETKTLEAAGLLNSVLVQKAA